MVLQFPAKLRLEQTQLIFQCEQCLMLVPAERGYAVLRSQQGSRSALQMRYKAMGKPACKIDGVRQTL